MSRPTTLAPGGDGLTAQVVVVGSGAGGAVTATTLAESGYEVLLLEEGPQADTARIASNSTEAIARLYRNGGMTPILGPQTMAFVEGRCVGGSTEINSGFWHRLPEDAYHRWRSDALLADFSPDVMDPYFARLEAELSVSYLGSQQVPKSSLLFREGIERLNWQYTEVPRCQSGNLGGSQFSPGAKQSMQRTYIPRALAAGVQLLPDCKVVRVTHESGRVRGVEVIVTSDPSTATKSTIRADVVFLCAGAIQTPALLRRSGIKKNVGDSLRVHPMIKAAALFDEEVDAHEAALPVYQVKEFWPTITIGGAVFSPGFLAMILSENWRAYQHAMENWSRMALYHAATRGMGRGTIRVLPRLDDGVVIRYRLSQADQRNLSAGLAHLGEILFAAGAKAVYPSLSSAPILRSADECRGFLRSPIPLASMGLSCVHAFSSCPMGENPDICATDSFGKVHGLRNLFVSDASLIPDSPGVNPQGVTMAIALRNSEHFVATSGRTLPGAQSRSAESRSAPQPDVLVTGAPGWLGTRLVEALAKGLPGVPALEGDGSAPRVRCLVHPDLDGSALAALSETVEVIAGDLTDTAAVDAFCRGAEGALLIHVAGIIHPRRWTRDFERINVDGTRRLLEAAQREGVRRVVAVSSNSPLGCNPYPGHLFDETSPYHPYMGYGRSKARMEGLVRTAQEGGRIETVIVRPPWFYGPHQPPRQSLFFTMIKEGRFPLLGDGDQQRSMAYVDNICQGVMRAAMVPEANGQTYWIADDQPYTVNEIVATVTEVLEEFGFRCKRRQLRLPSLVGDAAWLADYGLQSLGLYHQKIHVLGEMNKTIACSIAKAKAELGYAPVYALREGMACSVRWCLANGHAI